MAKNAQKIKKPSKTELIMLIIIIVLLAACGAALIMLLTPKNDVQSEEIGVQPGEISVQSEKNGTDEGIIKYDEAAVAFNADNLQEQLDEMQKKADEQQMALRYQKIARSSDGVNFKCEIGNSAANKYDMYINIYKDPELTEQILLTGLIPPGSEITEFESEIPLEPGTYNTTLVLTQVEDDHSTFHAQLMVVLDLVVE